MDFQVFVDLLPPLGEGGEGLAEGAARERRGAAVLDDPGWTGAGRGARRREGKD